MRIRAKVEVVRPRDASSTTIEVQPLADDGAFDAAAGRRSWSTRGGRARRTGGARRASRRSSRATRAGRGAGRDAGDERGPQGAAAARTRTGWTSATRACTPSCKELLGGRRGPGASRASGCGGRSRVGLTSPVLLLRTAALYCAKVARQREKAAVHARQRLSGASDATRSPRGASATCCSRRRPSARALADALRDVVRRVGLPRRSRRRWSRSTATLEAGAGGSLEGTAFRLVDLDGRLLALRPEMTRADRAARRLAARATSPARYRLRYVGRRLPRARVAARPGARSSRRPASSSSARRARPPTPRSSPCSSRRSRRAGLRGLHRRRRHRRGPARAARRRRRRRDEWRRERHARAATTATSSRSTRSCADAGAAAAARRGARAACRASRGGREAIERVPRARRARAGARRRSTTLERDVGAARGGRASRTACALDFGILRDFDYYTGLVRRGVRARARRCRSAAAAATTTCSPRSARRRPPPASRSALERLHIALAEQGVAPAAARLDAVLGGADAADVFARRARAARGGLARVAVRRRDGRERSPRRRARRRRDAARERRRIVRLDRAGEPRCRSSAAARAADATWATPRGASR